jgi:hypothetical protein
VERRADVEQFGIKAQTLLAALFGSEKVSICEKTSRLKDWANV